MADKKSSKTTDYTVKAGETPWAIAEQFYGGGSNWLKLAQDNEEEFSKKTYLRAGAKLKVPTDLDPSGM